MAYSQMEVCMMIISTIGRRGQMTVPRAIRRSLNLQEGDHVAFIRRGNEVVLQPLTNTLLDLRGSIPAAEPQDFAAIREQVIQEHAQKVAESGD
jgi:AbrB family looped-hinge helix DNA binding protein